MVAFDTSAMGTFKEGIPNPEGDSEASMLRLMQQHMATLMKPFVDHVDHLFLAVESLSGDLAIEQARSRKRYDEISLRLSNVDQTLTDCDVVVQAFLDKQSADVLEAAVQEQNHCQPDCLSNLHGQMQALHASLGTLDNCQDMIRRHVDSLSRRVSTVEAVAEKAASSLQEQTCALGLLGDVVKSALKNTHEAVGETAMQLTGAGRIMEPSTEEQQRKMSELKSLEQDKLSGVQARFEQFSERLNELTPRLAENLTGPCQVASVQSSVSPFRSVRQLATSAGPASEHRHNVFVSKVEIVRQLARRRIQVETPLLSACIPTGSADAQASQCTP